MSDNFAREVSKVVVAQIAKEFGFERIQHSATEALSDILQKYIEELGHTSRLYSELSGRTESNFNDVRKGLQEVGVALDDLYNFASVSDEVPFAKAIPEFPVKKEVKPPTSITTKPTSTSPLPPYIPAYLPNFPDSHSYIDTPVYEERLTDSRQIRKKKSKEKRHIETSLAKLNENLGNKPIVNYDTARKENPYLAPPRLKRTTDDNNNNNNNNNNNHTTSTTQPTPIQRDSPYLRTVIGKKASDNSQPDTDDNKRVYSEFEESERLRKRQKAEQILALKYEMDVIDHELPSVRGNAADGMPKTPTSIPSPAGPPSSIFPVVEKL